MLNKISFKNYKIFSQQQTLELSPITVIFGKNNSGKSAVLKLPLLIKNAINCESEEVFDKSDKASPVICENYSDVIYGKSSRAMSIGFTVDDSNLDVETEFYVEHGSDSDTTHIEHYVAKCDDQILEANIPEDSDNNIIKDIREGNRVNFKGIVPQNEKYSILRDKIKSEEFDTQYISCIRAIPPRYFGIGDLKHYPHGGILGISQYIELLLDAQNINHPLLDRVSNWYKQNFEGWGINIDASRFPIYSICLGNGIVENNIIDTGAGIAQSLPVVIAMCQDYSVPTLLIIEEPETHLHPAAHGQLAELVANTVKNNSNLHVIIETHSLNFIVRLRTLVAKKLLSKEDLGLYYVSYDNNKKTSSLCKVSVDGSGHVANWPKKVFNETLEEAIALRKAQMEG